MALADAWILCMQEDYRLEAGSLPIDSSVKADAQKS